MFAAPARKARADMGEKKWALYVTEQNELSARILNKTKREFDDFMKSPERAARDALAHGLNKLKNNIAIKKSGACLELLDALIWCLKHKWWAKDSEALLQPIGNEFRKVFCREIKPGPRPGRECPFRKAIVKAMKPGKSNEQTFKTFMQMWEQGNQKGLSVKFISDEEKYIFYDENGNLGEKKYASSTLEKMYSEARKTKEKNK